MPNPRRRKAACSSPAREAAVECSKFLDMEKCDALFCIVGPAARRVFGSKDNLRRGSSPLATNMSDVVDACFAAYAPSLQLLALRDTEDVVDATARPKQTVEAGPRRAHGH